MVKEREKYSKLLVQYIKNAGQDLIDMADSMVDDDLDLITNFEIRINFDQEFASIPTISWTTEVISKNTHKYLMEKGE